MPRSIKRFISITLISSFFLPGFGDAYGRPGPIARAPYFSFNAQAIPAVACNFNPEINENVFEHAREKQAAFVHSLDEPLTGPAPVGIASGTSYALRYNNVSSEIEREKILFLKAPRQEAYVWYPLGVALVLINRLEPTGFFTFALASHILSKAVEACFKRMYQAHAQPNAAGIPQGKLLINREWVPYRAEHGPLLLEFVQTVADFTIAEYDRVFRNPYRRGSDRVILKAARYSVILAHRLLSQQRYFHGGFVGVASEPESEDPASERSAPLAASGLRSRFSDIADALKTIFGIAAAQKKAKPELAGQLDLLMKSVHEFAAELVAFQKAAPEDQPRKAQELLRGAPARVDALERKIRGTFLYEGKELTSLLRQIALLRSVFGEIAPQKAVQETGPRQTAGAMSRQSIRELDVYEQIEAIRKQPFEDQLRLLDHDAGAVILRMKTWKMREDIHRAWRFIVEGRPWAIPGRDETLVKTEIEEVLANACQHLLNQQGMAERPLRFKLEGLSMDARRLVHKIVKNRMINEFVTMTDWAVFMNRVWDPEHKSLDADLLSALERYYKQIHRKELERAFPGKADHLIDQRLAGAAEELAWVAATMTAKEKRKLVFDSVDERAATLQTLNAQLKPDDTSSHQEQRRALLLQAENHRWQIVQQLRAWWDEGYVPTIRWLRKNHSAFLSDIDVYFGKLKIAFETAGLPGGIEQIKRYQPLPPEAVATSQLKVARKTSLTEFINNPTLRNVLAHALHDESNWPQVVMQRVRLKVEMPRLHAVTREAAEEKARRLLERNNVPIYGRSYRAKLTESSA